MATKNMKPNKNIFPKGINTIDFDEKLFEKGNDTLIASEVEPDMIIALSNNRFFYIDDIDKEFANEFDILYPDILFDINPVYPVLPEHTKLTFINENEQEIINIPGTANVIAYKRIKGKHTKNNI